MGVWSGFACLTADEAAAMIPHGATVAFSGFTPAGAAKEVPAALARRATRLHARDQAYQLRVLTGASTGRALDEALADADAVSWRVPYQASSAMRRRINAQQTEFADLHLSHVPQQVEYGFLGRIDFAVVEAVDLTADGRVFLSTSVGASPTYLRHADKVFVEINRHHLRRLAEMHDILVLSRPPHRVPIDIRHPLGRIGRPYARVEANRIAGVVETDVPDGVAAFDEPDHVSNRIAEHVVRFLVEEMHAGRIPGEFLPLQSGVGNIANAVLHAIGHSPEIPPFAMYTEVFQDAAAELMTKGRLIGASACSLTLSDPRLQCIYADMDQFASRIVLRPQELSNNPGIIRQLGVISINTALEMDIYGNANSTHICGTQAMNGIGGSADFARNAYLSIFVAPSITRGDSISTIVPMVSHVDHSEHSTHVFVTEQGLADLRGLGPAQRARRIIERCAHPAYRDYLHRYLAKSRSGHIHHDLAHCFDLHLNLIRTGRMLPDAD